MKNKLLITIITLFIGSLLFETAHSAWVFNSLATTNNTVHVEVTNWHFNLSSLKPGDIVIINNDGIVTINGEEIESNLDFGENDSAYNGSSGATTNLEIIVNDSGTLSITAYDLKPNAALFGTNDGTAYFPQYLNVNGENILVTAILEPVNFESTKILFADSQVNKIVIPEGYQTICNNAFYDCSLDSNTIFDFPSTLTQIGSKIINVSINNTWTINYNGTTAQWNQINKPNNWKSGDGTVKVACSNGTLTY